MPSKCCECRARTCPCARVRVCFVRAGKRFALRKQGTQDARYEVKSGGHCSENVEKIRGPRIELVLYEGGEVRGRD
jgi:hypothetical protein